MRTFFVLYLVLCFTASIVAQNSAKRAIAIRDYKKVIDAMIEEANGLTLALGKAKTAAAATRAMDSFSNQMAKFQSQLVELDKQYPEFENEETPEELKDSISQLQTSMSTLAQTLALAGEKFGNDLQFQQSVARLTQTLGVDEEEEAYDEEYLE